jgi:hypothetical protein
VILRADQVGTLKKSVKNKNIKKLDPHFPKQKNLGFFS